MVKKSSKAVEDVDDEPVAPAKKKAKVAAPSEPFVDEDGWTVHPPSLLYKDYGSKPSEKIAGFDLDGTLVNVKSGMQFPRTADDWRLFNKHVPKLVQQYHNDGYKVVVFSNQGGVKSALTGKMSQKVRARVDQVMAKLGVPGQVFLATMDDEFRKPESGMWKFMSDHHNGGKVLDPQASIFIGDAAGRPGDFADSDKAFAAALSIQFKTPEDVFGEMEGKRPLPGPAGAPGGPSAGGAGGGGAPENGPLTDVFNQLAVHLTQEGKQFQARAFQKVAGVIKSWPTAVTKSNYKELGKAPGVGKGSLAVIEEWVMTGKCKQLEEAGIQVEQGAKTGETAGDKKAGGDKGAMAFM